MSDYPRAGTFNTQLNTPFRIHLSPISTIEVELVEVTQKGAFDGQQAQAIACQERFSIVFRGPHDKLLQQRMYQMHHDQLGALTLFLVPVGQDREGLYYEAIFNRLRRQDA